MTEAPPSLISVASTGALRRPLIVASLALGMLVVAITAALFESQLQRNAQEAFEERLVLAGLALDAGRLGAQMRELAAALAAPSTTGASALVAERLPQVTADLRIWDQHLSDLDARELDAGERERLLRLQAALRAWQHALAAHVAADTAVDSRAALAAPDATESQAGHAAEVAIDGALAALLSSLRAGLEAALATRWQRLAHAVMIVAGMAAVALSAALAILARRALMENRATIGALGKMVLTDPLTGVTNRRGLDDGLPVELARAKRAGQPLSAVMLDMDYFKRYNSRRGHAGGDALLRTAAQSWRRQLRPTDVLARYGGEEFTLVLPGCDADQACILVDRLRPLVPDYQTFSAGVAIWDGAEPAAELLRRADQALQLAKKQGRNRTVVSGRESQISLPLLTG